MGNLISPQKEIDRLRFVPFPTRPTKDIAAVVRVSGLIVASSKSQQWKVYVNHCQIAKSAAFLPGDWPWQDDLLTALRRLGVVSRAVSDAHKQLVKERARKGEAASLIKYTLPRLKAYGVTLTKSQMRKLKA